MSDSQPGRNDPCHCGSGRKYKQCCLEKDEAAARAARAKAAAEAALPAEPAPEPVHVAAGPPRHETAKPWKRGATNTRGFHKFTAPRKVGS